MAAIMERDRCERNRRHFGRNPRLIESAFCISPLIMDFPLIAALLLRRSQRFLAGMRLADGEVMTVHPANAGSMLG